MHEFIELESISAQEAWVPPGRTVRVRGRRIPGGMVYVGSGLRAVAFELPESALIDPALPIETRLPAGASDEPLPFWPSYSELSPAARAAYLRWLEGGRCDARADIAFVSLFFYGLERRVLHDVDTVPEARGDFAAIAAEVERLLALYGRLPGFREHALEFLDVLRWKAGGPWPATPPLARHGTEPPLSLRVAAGRMALAGRPLPAPWAFSWALCDPETHLPPAALGGRRELGALFAHRYCERYGEGLRLEPSRKRIEIRYLTASDSFGGPIEIPTDVPDVVSLRVPRRELRALLTECCGVLRPYNRCLQRSAGRAGRLRAATFLPAEIVDAAAPAEFLELRRRLQERLGGDERVVVEAADHLAPWLPRNGRPQSASKAVAAARVLAGAGFGMEPDVRFGGRPLRRGDRVVVFPLGPEAPAQPSPAYALAVWLLKLGVGVAAVDGRVSPAERRQLDGYLDAGSALNEGERRRLAARLESLLLEPPRFLGTRKPFESLSGDDRRRIGRFLVRIAWADGEVDPQEVKVLARAYRLLDQDPGALHQDLHDARATPTPASTRPVWVRTAGGRAAGFAIPAPAAGGRREDAGPPGRAGAEEGHSAGLDRELLERKLEETAAVSALLAGIFAGDEPVPAVLCGEPAGEIDGLDRAHAELLRRLGERGRWSRSEYDALAASLGLFPDGALDRLNDAAFAGCDAPLAEGEDPIEIDLDVFRELTS